MDSFTTHNPHSDPQQPDSAQPFTGVPADWLRFSAFDIQAVLRRGRLLLATSGAEYEKAVAGLDPKARLDRQKKILKQQLGLEDIGDPVEELISADDLGDESTAGRKHARDTADDAFTNELAGLSAQERNQRKRLAKTEAKRASQQVVQAAPLRSNSASHALSVTDQRSDDKIVVEAKIDLDSFIGAECEWPFQARCEELCHDLFNPVWQVRHGAGIGLREIIKTHGAGAGKSKDVPEDMMEVSEHYEHV